MQRQFQLAGGAQTAPKRSRAMLAMGAAVVALAGCDTLAGLDIDLRNRNDGFTTATAVANLPDRPRPDNRGVISYPNFQVVVAQRGDTVQSIANRLGVDAATLARYNGIEASTPLRRDEIIALPGRVAEPSPATGAVATGPILPAGQVDVEGIATAAINNAPVTTTTLPDATPSAPTPRPQTGVEPIRHQVTRGETAYTIARLYGVPVRTIGEWNGLGPDLGVREGQFLLIPPGGTPAPAVTETSVTPPGTGSVTPLPPSASAPLPEDEPPTTGAAEATPAPEPETPNLGAEQTAPPRSAQFVTPVQGSIIRAYSRGRNEGIDIGAPAGTAVQAADAGTVAAITTNTEGVQILVIRHTGDLLTVYTNINGISVARGDRISRGQTIAQVAPGDPSFLHFEVRNGMESRDPSDFLP
jgi:murein DD-endopeptidase MepM/ murein hydrolase activator NlpD